MKISKEIKTGFVFIVAIALFVWGYNYLKGSNLLNKQTRLYAIYDQVDGLMSASPITINGMKVGQVTDIHFLSYEDPRIVAEFTLEEKIPIPKNSIARIYSADIMGSKSINIIFGNGIGHHQNGDTLISEIEAGLAEEVNKQVQPIKAKAESLLASIDTLVQVIEGVFNEQTQNDLNESWANIRSTVQNLNSTTHNMDLFVTENRNRFTDIVINLDSITTELNSSRSKISNVLNNVSAFTDTLVAVDLAKTIANTNEALNEFAGIVHRIDQGEGSLGQLINNDTLYRKLEGATGELEMLLEDMKLHPKRYVHFSVFGKSDKKNKYEAPSEK
ncbi:MAG: MCE family protein [Bacteroidales bacterium]|nr:MCE family protein [Bacteroidales bacterium]